MAPVPILIAVTLSSYVAGILLEHRRSRGVLLLAIGVTALPLLSFKYLRFMGSLSGTGFGGTSLAWDGAIGLPVGISFYTLQAISYVVDVYRRTIPAVRNPEVFAQYLAFFPKLLAGPIERAKSLIPQLIVMRTPTNQELYRGFKTILWGYFCKLVIANNVAVLVDALLDKRETVGAASLPIALYLYSFQIYFDFYGYSMIAIGLGLTFGVRLSLNFNNPYLAVSIREFWRRWHITLSSWLRDYVYQPLGGRRMGTTRFVLAVVVAFLVSGLWHGAALTFLVWGLVHAVFYITGDASYKLRSRMVQASRIQDWAPRTHVFFQVVICFTLVSFAWVFFVADDLTAAKDILGRIGSLAMDRANWRVDPLVWRFDSLVFLSLLGCAFLLDSSGVVPRILRKAPQTRAEIAKELSVVNLLLITIVLFGDLGNRAFIYFRF